MRKWRETLGKNVNRLAGGFGAGGTELAAGDDPAKIGTITWIVLLLIWVIVSFVLVRFMEGNSLQYVLAAMWGIFIGGTMLIFFSSKVLITIIGGIVGTSLSNLAGLADVIDKMAAAILKIIKSVNAALHITIQPLGAWLFVVLVLICCLPAYKDQ
jgi:hypothetical protein